MKRARLALNATHDGGPHLFARAQRKPPYRRRATCRVCRSKRLRVFLDLGSLPLANAFQPASETARRDQRYPLSCAYCDRCGLVQVPDVVDPALLFTRYNYFSSASEPAVAHFRRQAELIRTEYLNDPSELICEIGSNDGTFLQEFVGKCRAVGVDPADNISPTAALHGVTTIHGFFNRRLASTIRQTFGPAKVLFAANTFTHVDEIDGIMKGVLELLTDDGVFIFENHRFVHLLRTLCFDQIYHEHLCYFALRPIEHLMHRFGMRVIDARLIPTQGQSFQIHCARIGSKYEERPEVERIRREEGELGLDRPETYAELARVVARRQKDLKELLLDLKSRGKRIVGYGAPGKATMLLNALRIDSDVVEYAVDSTPVKQGCLIPGTRIPIKAPQTLQADSPDYLLLLAWNYTDAILKKKRRSGNAASSSSSRYRLPKSCNHTLPMCRTRWNRARR